jgi:hypothetical protein
VVSRSWSWDVALESHNWPSNLALLLTGPSRIARLLPAVAACNLLKGPAAERARWVALRRCEVGNRQSSDLARVYCLGVAPSHWSGDRKRVRQSAGRYSEVRCVRRPIIARYFSCLYASLSE